MRRVAISLALLTCGCPEDSTTEEDTDASGTTGGTGGSTSGVASSSGAVDGTGTSGGVQPSPYLAFGSGSRLQAVVSRSPDGEDALQWWFDTELEIECVIAYDDEGGIRCLPRNPVTLSYGEANCNIAAVRNDGCFEEGQTVSAVRRDCQGRVQTSVFELRETIPNVYDRDGAGNCILDMEAMDTANRASRVELAAYALATPRIEPEDAELGRLVVEFEGGAWAWVSAYDTARDTECDLWNVDGQSVCVPSFRAGIQTALFAGQNCSGSALAVDLITEGCSDPVFARELGPTSVAETLADGLWEVGNPVEEPYADPDGMGCVPFAPVGALTYYRTNPVDGSYPGAQVLEMGEGRFLPLFLSSGDTAIATHGAPLAPQLWQDTLLNFPCSVEELSTGSFGCVPGPKLRTTWFADEACTVPVIDEQPPLLSGGPMRPSDWFSLVGAPDCTGKRTTYAIATMGALHEGPVFRELEDGTCQPDALPMPHLLENIAMAEEIPVFEQVVVP